MKTLLRAVGILATLHLMAVAGGIGWIVGTGRLDERRWGELRAMFAETTAQRDAREAVTAEVEPETGERLAEVPLTAEQQIDRKLTLSEADRQVLQRMRREIDDLRRALQTERAQLDAERAAFLADREAFAAERERIMATEGQEQFRSVLATLKTMKPELAHSLLSATIADQPDGMTVAVAYLDNLPPRTSAAVLKEFEEQDPALAAQLLERLRTRGVVAAADGQR
jgi:hypothetical protein